MSTRLIAKITGRLPEPKVKHFIGFPPELTDNVDRRVLMEWPSFIVLEETSEGIFLDRFTAEGCNVGDTWHMTIEEAKRQADFEFEQFVSNWMPVPHDVEDVVAFGMSLLKEGSAGMPITVDDFKKLLDKYAPNLDYSPE